MKSYSPKLHLRAGFTMHFDSQTFEILEQDGDVYVVQDGDGNEREMHIDEVVRRFDGCRTFKVEKDG